MTASAAEPRTWRALCGVLEVDDLVDRLTVSAEEQAVQSNGRAVLAGKAVPGSTSL
ncbi:hypothetical protein [Parafrankia soli]|uniref:hypothetical protein n=1 Tax=Parafrankia soli TaxID=2599596 RepID=UPI001F5274B5|nr:hypothetical protein [Parafrankia soli]